MKLRAGNIWDVVPELGERDLLCITTNAVVRRDTGQLVMGAGIALEARDRFPGLAKRAGRRVEIALQGNFGRKPQPDGQPYYGLIVLRPGEVETLTFNLGLFQTKYDHRNPSPLELVKRSAQRLMRVIDVRPSDRPEGTVALNLEGGQVHLPLPGTGLGGLDRAVVINALSWLPRNVTLWERA